MLDNHRRNTLKQVPTRNKGAPFRVSVPGGIPQVLGCNDNDDGPLGNKGRNYCISCTCWPDVAAVARLALS